MLGMVFHKLQHPYFFHLAVLSLFNSCTILPDMFCYNISKEMLMAQIPIFPIPSSFKFRTKKRPWQEIRWHARDTYELCRGRML
ncbi:unnamed protein product [Staurois parvus]|uniref:Secreted protein n=1 Tax=Staurois parvus TaxID=386267 RepID=A0ABN9FT33_9NEOB|nr:unnamed protein product [Staurois parvus]